MTDAERPPLPPFHIGHITCCEHCPPDCPQWHPTDCAEGCRALAFGIIVADTDPTPPPPAVWSADRIEAQADEALGAVAQIVTGALFGGRRRHFRRR